MERLQIFQLISQKMQWHQARQNVLAENVANVDTPHYKGQDLKTMDFSQRLESERTMAAAATTTNDKHFSTTFPVSETSRFKTGNSNSFEITPDGNAVVLEEQMMKVTNNQMEYQVATSLYSRGMGIIKTALGRR